MDFPKAVTISILLTDGTPDGLRTVEKSLWTGIAVVCSRAQFPHVSHHDWFSQAGVYVLTGPDPDAASGEVVYIGQAEVARQRLKQHLDKKDEWTQLVLFINKDANINSTHFRFLEAQLINLAQKAKRARVLNGNQPGVPKLSIGETAVANAFLADMLVIYPLLGISAFDRPAVTPGPQPTDPPLLQLVGRGVTARGYYRSEGFIVTKGSEVRLHPVPSFAKHGYSGKRTELIERGVIELRHDRGIFTVDYTFNSPSAAASIVRGSSQNGLTEWMADDGRTLAQLLGADK